MTTPTSLQPHVQAYQECIKNSEISPQDLALSGNSECSISISDTHVSGNTLSWSMQCSTPYGIMKGQGSFESKGDSGSGQMTMGMDIEGQPFAEMAWEGRRVGSC